MTRRAAAALLALAAGCATRPAPSVVTGVGAPTQVPPPASDRAEPELPADASAALDALADGARRNATSLGVALARGAGALAITGDPAPDDRVAEATVVGRAGRSAAVLVVTACGNVWVVGLGYDGGRWAPRAQAAVFDGARPGACRVTRAEAASRAMLSDAPREVVVTFVSESEDGGEARDPALRLFHLEPDGAVVALGGEVALGGTDDRSGAVRDGQWVIEETLQTPRDLYVQIQPGRVGPGGTAPQVVIRRTYRVRGRALEMVEETAGPYRPARGSASEGGLLRPGLL